MIDAVELQRSAGGARSPAPSCVSKRINVKPFEIRKRTSLALYRLADSLLRDRISHFSPSLYFYWLPIISVSIKFITQSQNREILIESRTKSEIVDGKQKAVVESRTGNFLTYWIGWTIVWRHVIMAFSSGAGRWRCFCFVDGRVVTIRQTKRSRTLIARTMRSRQCTLNIFMLVGEADALVESTSSVHLR